MYSHFGIGVKMRKSDSSRIDTMIEENIRLVSRIEQLENAIEYAKDFLIDYVDEIVVEEAFGDIDESREIEEFFERLR